MLGLLCKGTPGLLTLIPFHTSKILKQKRVNYEQYYNLKHNYYYLAWLWIETSNQWNFIEGKSNISSWSCSHVDKY